ncbi:MAG: ribonuclease III [Pacificimonas sp.]
MTTPLSEWAEVALGYQFTDLSLVQRALTHKSGEAKGARGYERLEFLGDRVLGLVMADWLFTLFDEPEGKLNRRLATLVDKRSCAAVAREIGADDHVLLNEAARAADVHRSENLLGDVCEALIAALYLDGGLSAAQSFIREAWSERLDAGSAPPRNPKNTLQEWAQGRGLPLPVYEVVARDGPDHAPHFKIAVAVRGHSPVEGAGASKQEAEKVAASRFLKQETK